MTRQDAIEEIRLNIEDIRLYGAHDVNNETLEALKLAIKDMQDAEEVERAIRHVKPIDTDMRPAKCIICGDGLNYDIPNNIGVLCAMCRQQAFEIAKDSTDPRDHNVG